MAYPPVQISNSTPYAASGTVHLASIFCSNDDYWVGPNTTWTEGGRGACLVTKIDAVVVTPQGNISATPYESSGTSYSQYAVIQTGANSFEVTRRVTGAEDEPPADYVEPTTEQK
jgi:hypothetical protein